MADKDNQAIEDEIDNNEDNSESQSSFIKALFTKYLAFLIIFILLCIIGLQYIAGNNEIEKIVEEKNNEQIVLLEKAKSILDEKDSTALRLLMKPLVWAIRAEMLRDNMDQVNQYSYQMVKEKNFQLVLIATNGGEVISSTDKKIEGAMFTDHFDKKYLMNDKTMTQVVDSSLLYVSTPIMGYDSKLGTLFIQYKRELDRSKELILSVE